MIDFGGDFCNIDIQSFKLERFLLLVCQLSQMAVYAVLNHIKENHPNHTINIDENAKKVITRKIQLDIGKTVYSTKTIKKSIEENFMKMWNYISLSGDHGNDPLIVEEVYELKRNLAHYGNVRPDTFKKFTKYLNASIYNLNLKNPKKFIRFKK